MIDTVYFEHEVKVKIELSTILYLGQSRESEALFLQVLQVICAEMQAQYINNLTVIMDHASCQKLMIQSKPPEF
jgi:hypothetical protein